MNENFDSGQSLLELYAVGSYKPLGILNHYRSLVYFSVGFVDCLTKINLGEI